MKFSDKPVNIADVPVGCLWAHRPTDDASMYLRVQHHWDRHIGEPFNSGDGHCYASVSLSDSRLVFTSLTSECYVMVEE